MSSETQLAPDERRSEPRRPASGPVALRLNGRLLATVPGLLLDIADSGFRARHASSALVPGEVVDFEFAGGEGRARVIWTRILGERVESGFLILPQPRQ
jgi:hypothetical protein